MAVLCITITCGHICLLYCTYPRNRNRLNRNLFDQRLSSSQKNMNSLAWVLLILSVCPIVILTNIEFRSNLELASRIFQSKITKNRGACALTRAGGLP